MFVNATIQIHPSIIYLSPPIAPTPIKKRSCHQSICDNELHGHPDSIDGRLYYKTKYNKHSENS